VAPRSDLANTNHRLDSIRGDPDEFENLPLGISIIVDLIILDPLDSVSDRATRENIILIPYGCLSTGNLRKSRESRGWTFPDLTDLDSRAET
jgi:hypothetical protein